MLESYVLHFPFEVWGFSGTSVTVVWSSCTRITFCPPRQDVLFSAAADFSIELSPERKSSRHFFKSDIGSRVDRIGAVPEEIRIEV
ncbi:hypothetical protein HPP92_007835 [Vanilla planifolia]|uniref:Uncharacterized protein n=1 Tax=Vanilla planifolia TaxID=51239 RepID=A0A835V698_VANPL|nr:hypothetical protein HPP92_007835 [Vanilla planifolia]